MVAALWGCIHLRHPVVVLWRCIYTCVESETMMPSDNYCILLAVALRYGGVFTLASRVSH